MHFLISLILGGIFLFFLARAIIETVIGLCHVAIGLTLLAIAYALDVLAWCIRVFHSLWRTAVG